MLCLGRIVSILCCLLILAAVMSAAYLLSNLHPVVIISSPILNITLDPTGPESDVIG